MKTRELTAGDLAEIAGANIAMAMLNSMLRAKSQPERIAPLFLSLQRPSEDCESRDRAIGGFSVVLVNVIEQGLGVTP